MNKCIFEHEAKRKLSTHLAHPCTLISFFAVRLDDTLHFWLSKKRLEEILVSLRIWLVSAFCLKNIRLFEIRKCKTTIRIRDAHADRSLCSAHVRRYIFAGCNFFFFFWFVCFFMLRSKKKSGESIILYRPKFWVSVHPSVRPIVRQHFHHSCPLHNSHAFEDIFTKPHTNVKHYETAAEHINLNSGLSTFGVIVL